MEIRQVWTPFAGAPQTRHTLELMKGETLSAVYSPLIVQTAVNIVRGVNGRDKLALAAAINEWVRLRVSYLDDPIIFQGGDFLRTPEYVLEEIQRYGIARIDCDDAAMFVAALALCVGLAPRFHAVAFFDPAAPFSHVYTEVETGSGWMPLDVTGLRTNLPVSRDMILEVV